jgi:hypothetical protein
MRGADADAEVAAAAATATRANDARGGRAEDANDDDDDDDGRGSPVDTSGSEDGGAHRDDARREAKTGGDARRDVAAAAAAATTTTTTTRGDDDDDDDDDDDAVDRSFDAERTVPPALESILLDVAREEEDLEEEEEEEEDAAVGPSSWDPHAAGFGLPLTTPRASMRITSMPRAKVLDSAAVARACGGGRRGYRTTKDLVVDRDRRDDDDEVLKERRSPRERGRMGTSHAFAASSSSSLRDCVHATLRGKGFRDVDVASIETDDDGALPEVLRVLDVSDNHLADLGALAGLSALTHLVAPCNAVAVASLPTPTSYSTVHIPPFASLRVLDVSFNRLDCKCFEPLSTIATLRSLNLSGNAISKARSIMFTLVPIRPRRRGERRSLRTLLSPGASLRPGSLGFNPDTPRHLPFNSATDAFQLHPDLEGAAGRALRRRDGGREERDARTPSRVRRQRGRGGV